MFNIARSIRKFLGNSLTSAGLWSWVTPGHWGKADMLQQYQRVVYSVVSAIAEDAAKITFTVVKKGGLKDTPIKKHDFLTLMKRPNPMYSQFQFLELHFTYLKMVGESYWYIVKNKGTKKPQALYLLRPDLMQVVVEKNNNPFGLVSGYVMVKPDGNKVPFDLDEVLHIKMPNPNNHYYGFDTVEAASAYIQS